LPVQVAQWAKQVGLSTDCGLLHRPLGSTVSPNEGRKEVPVV